MKRFVALSLAALATLTLAACENQNGRELQGWVEGEMIFVSPDEQGRVEILNVREGDRVQKGKLLFTLDDDLQKADVAVKRAALINAQQVYNRAEELLRSASGTKKALDDAEAALRQAKANLQAAQTRLTRRRVLSPVNGTVQEVYFRAGETVQPARPVVALLPPRNLKIRFFAPETKLARIKIGETVDVSCDACAKGLTAKVSFIAQSAEYTPPVIYSRKERAKLVYLIEARPTDPEKFRVGQPVTVMLPPEGVSQ
ncbi:MAG: efflux RND transporter periplasmic adaptor subunit [Pseudolabrys sp.]